MSYNVHGQRDDRAALATVVRSEEPDVLVVQEGPRRLRWRTRSADLAARLGLLVAGGGLPALGNLVLTSPRVRVHEHWAVRYPLTPGRHLRGAAFVRCSVAGTPFVVAGSHLATDPVERPAQAARLRDLLTEIELPTVLAIDVNDEPGGTAFTTIRAALRDSAEVAGVLAAGTYPIPAATRRIDAIFVSVEWGVLDYAVVDTTAARAASDHFPVRVDLALPKGWTRPAAAGKDFAPERDVVGRSGG